MADQNLGSLTKEPPLATLDATIRAIRPGMTYNELLDYARTHTHRDAPGLIRKRFLLVEHDGTIAYDQFLSLAEIEGLESPLVRKVMYFVWAYRDPRIRRFVCERVAGKNGKWRLSQLINKKNADFFEEWLQAGAATKARSNFEYFLVETRLYDPRRMKLHLELEDGWLNQAALVAAQHEPDPILRNELLADAAQFLVDKDWVGLLNASVDELPRGSPILVTDSIPLEDEGINVAPATLADGRDWDRKGPLASGRKTKNIVLDLVARERANQAHYLLEKSLAQAIAARGMTPKYNNYIDVYFKSVNVTVLAEIKSCNATNFHSQVRKGLSQLFEYCYRYKAVFKDELKMVLVMETAPPRQKLWLADYLSSLNITLAWKEHGTTALVTTCELPPELDGIVGQR